MHTDEQGVVDFTLDDSDEDVRHVTVLNSDSEDEERSQVRPAPHPPPPPKPRLSLSLTLEKCDSPLTSLGF